MALVDRLYGRLPAVFRDVDVEAASRDRPADAVPVSDEDVRRGDAGTRPLYSYLDVALDAANELDALVDELELGLADPARARPEWLAWLAQHVGVRPRPGTLFEDQRETIVDRATGLAIGTRDAIASAARRALTGGRSVNVVPNYNGDPFTIGLRTLELETPNLARVAEAVIDAGAKPAGFRLETFFYSASWDTLENAYPTSSDWDAVPSWQVLESTAEGTAPPPTAETALATETGDVLTAEDDLVLTTEER